MNDQIIGWIATVVAAVAFGSVYVPLKPYDLGDGMFVQWVQSSALLACGAVVFVVRQCPPFHPLAVLSGVVYTCGNVFIVPIVNRIGLTLTTLIVGSVQIVIGWGTARFGFFGLRQQTSGNIWLECIGVGLTVVSVVLFTLVKPTEKRVSASDMNLPGAPATPNVTKTSMIWCGRILHHKVKVAVRVLCQPGWAWRSGA